ncbi:ABC-type Fe3+-siderophore transport system, permease component [Leucobacter sp. 7(1)]|uniref:FecCD family ABC transporter permease n=1 Tax=Leucobacter sp. 7(1) TaxID=1255613 RepID=UPI00097F60C7|nr:iron chelate uptake ABC transporter family permease subunit [Leucobacter sp. 7(1)]SJN10852.1 ABC-type Fe3+-siderophore transport system, permease component [Leucobacter sp. 7(1)]
MALALGLWVGARSLDFGDVWRVLWHADGSEASYIVHEMRLPRSLLALVIGLALGVAGALIQALTRNPLADTGILGVGAGASFAVVVGVAFFGVTSFSQYMWLAFLGAVVVTVLVYALGSIGSLGATPVRLTLVGVALGALLGGFSSAITMLNPDSFSDVLRWSAGSLAGRGWDTLEAVLLPIGIGLLIALGSGRPLNAVSLGDDVARSLGANVLRTRILVIVSVTLLAGAAAAATGPVGFVGLMVPHVVRWFTGPDQRWIIPFSAVGAALLLLAADVLGRVVLAPRELEVGIVTAFIGAPVLIALARRRNVSAL